MQNEKLSEVIKALVSQVSLKEIGTRDFVAEMEALYKKVDELETAEKFAKTNWDIAAKQRDQMQKDLDQYKQAYVIPALDLQKKEAELIRKNTNWLLEKQYVERENKILSEIVAQLTAHKNISQYGGNGGGSYNESAARPTIPPLKTME